MNTYSEKEMIEDLKGRKKKIRQFARNLSPTEKVRQLELLQKRHYELLKARRKTAGAKFLKNGEGGVMLKTFESFDKKAQDYEKIYMLEVFK